MADPTVLDLALDNVPEQTVLPAGEEHELELVKITMKKGKDSGNPYINAMVSISDLVDVDVAPIWHIMMMPLAEDTVADQNSKRRRIAEFTTSFSLDTTDFQAAVAEAMSMGLDVDNSEAFSNFKKQNGRGILGVGQDQEKNDNNNIKKFTV